MLVESGEEDDLRAVGWELENEALVAQIARHGIPVVAGDRALSASRRVGLLFHCTDPNGLRHELYFGPEMAPMDQTFCSPLLHSAFVAGHLGAGHFVAIAADSAATAHFHFQALGLRLSDYIRGRVAPGVARCSTRPSCMPPADVITPWRLGIGSMNAVYFEIEVETATHCAGAKGRMASSTAAAVMFATEFRYPMWSAAWVERIVEGA